MATVRLVEGVGDLACDNCGTTQSHKVVLLYDDATNELRIEKSCVCEVAGVPYRESRAVEVLTE